jgi:hypothetical protein
MTLVAGPQVAANHRVGSFSMAEMIGGFVFGSIGFVAFVYGKRMHVWKPMMLGLALMAYPYFAPNAAVVFGVGVVLTAALFLFRG